MNLPEQDTQPSPQSYRTIPLTKGVICLVDEIDYEWAMQWKWCTSGGYARRVKEISRVPRKNLVIYMHREIAKRAGLEIPDRTDHRNRQRADNRRSNLRPANGKENSINRSVRFDNLSGFTGVSFNKRTNKFNAYIYDAKHHIYLGSYDTAKNASDAYNAAAVRIYGEFSPTFSSDEMARPAQDVLSPSDVLAESDR